MTKKKRHFQIYRYYFRLAETSDLEYQAEGVEARESLGRARECFAELFRDGRLANMRKTPTGGESTPLDNKVLRQRGDIIYFRVNNVEKKELWKPSDERNEASEDDNYVQVQDESYPPAYVVIDNREGRFLMAIEKTSAYKSDPDALRDLLSENFNALLRYHYGIEIHIRARVNPQDIWAFVHHRILEHSDRITKVAITLQNPDKTRHANRKEPSSEFLKQAEFITRTTKAIEGEFRMKYQNDEADVSQRSRDLAEIANLVDDNGYELSIYFSRYGVYRAGEKVRAAYAIEQKTLNEFKNGTQTLSKDVTDGRDLVSWMDRAFKDTAHYVDDEEV